MNPSTRLFPGRVRENLSVLPGINPQRPDGHTNQSGLTYNIGFSKKGLRGICRSRRFFNPAGLETAYILGIVFYIFARRLFMKKK
jgi:hypothetical protein